MPSGSLPLTKFDLLRKTNTDVYRELCMQLDPLDQRWMKFGFNDLGANQSPEQVTDVKVTLIGPMAFSF